MATQFSLSYDNAGNASLVENKIATKAAVTGTFNIDPYAPIRSCLLYTSDAADE